MKQGIFGIPAVHHIEAAALRYEERSESIHCL